MESPLGAFLNPPGTPQEEPAEQSSASSEVSEKPVVTQPLDGLERIALQDSVIEVLRGCYDPEIPVNIYELGLIYEVQVEASGETFVKMTLTAPNCPAAASLPMEVKQKVEALPQVTAAKVDVVWEPPWDPSKMSEAARLQLGMF